MSIVKEGWPFIVFPICIGALLFFAGRGWPYAAWILVIFGLFCSFFFRDPLRNIPEGENIILGPGDGRVLEVAEEDGKKVIRIFLSVFNVHLQRAPVAGLVKSVEYKSGRCLPAMMGQAHSVNEQNIIIIQSPKGEFQVRQIAGILARRVVSWVKPQQQVKTGDKIGLIKFGSQVDLYMPDNVEIIVKKGDRIVGGETIVGRIKN